MGVYLSVPSEQLATPLEGVKLDFNYGCRVTVPEGKYRVYIEDMGAHNVLFDGELDNQYVETEKKYFIRYKVEITSPDGKSYVHEYNAEGQNVAIRFPETVIGDILSWFDYAEEFRKTHKCNLYVTVAPYMEEMLKPMYTEINFIRADEYPPELYASYYMGIFFPSADRNHQPVDFHCFPLWAAAPHILGLPLVERTVKLYHSNERIVKERYVCIAVQATAHCKHWNNAIGWYEVVRYLKEMGYKVLCIDKEPWQGSMKNKTVIPYGAEDYTGSTPLIERAAMLANADFFIGLGSGLSWLAHAVGCQVIMISGFSHPFTEFTTPYRVINYNACTGCWNDSSFDFDHDDYDWCPRHKGTEREYECTKLIDFKQVTDAIDRLMKDNQIIPPNEENKGEK